MRRRRKGNPVLAKTMLISFGVVLLLLPILGYLGAFKTVKEEYTEVTMVKLPPPPPAEKQPPAKKARPKAQTRHEGHQHVAGGSRPVPVHVAAASSAPLSSDDNSIVNSNNTNIGAPPTQAGSPPAVPPTPTPVPIPPTPAINSVPPVAAPPTPPAIPDQDSQVIADSQVKPVIPDDLTDSDLDAQFRGVFTIHADGTTDVKMVSSTGNNELDAIALDAARRWRFRPAIRNGKPVDSYMRLWVEFQVS